MLKPLAPGDAAPVTVMLAATERANSDDPRRVVTFAMQMKVLRGIATRNPELRDGQTIDEIVNRCDSLLAPVDVQHYYLLHAAESVIPSPYNATAVADILRASEGIGIAFGMVSSLPRHPEFHNARHDSYVIERLRRNPSDYLHFLSGNGVKAHVAFNQTGKDLLAFGRDPEAGGGCPMLAQKTDRKYPHFGKNFYRLFWRGLTEVYIDDTVQRTKSS